MRRLLPQAPVRDGSARRFTSASTRPAGPRRSRPASCPRGAELSPPGPRPSSSASASPIGRSYLTSQTTQPPLSKVTRSGPASGRQGDFRLPARGTRRIIFAPDPFRRSPPPPGAESRSRKEDPPGSAAPSGPLSRRSRDPAIRAARSAGGRRPSGDPVLEEPGDVTPGRPLDGLVQIGRVDARHRASSGTRRARRRRHRRRRNAGACGGRAPP